MTDSSVVVANGPGEGGHPTERILVEIGNEHTSRGALPRRPLIREAHRCNETARVIGASPGTSPETPRASENDTHSAIAHRVLVVEDNLVNQLVAVGLLRKRGLEVEIAANGRDALAMHRRSPYDAIFMDCQMPELDGYDTTREIRRREGSDRRTPIIAMTASTMPGDRERCLAAGMDYYTGKPVKPAGLDYAIARSLGAS
jgi:two-component system, sensor histidine kinase and response regulator